MIGRMISDTYRLVQKKVPLFEIPALLLHGKSANFGKFKLYSLNLAAFFSLHPVQ